MTRTAASIGWAGIATVVFAAALLLSSGTGRAGRVHAGEAGALGSAGIEVRVTETSAEAYALWSKRGVRGRVLVYASRFLHFIEPERPFPADPAAAFPLDLLGRYARSVSHRDLLWLAMRGQVARSVVHLLPPDGFSEKAQSAPDLMRDGEIVTLDYGFVRRLSDRVPELAEPALLGIDASLVGGQGDRVLRSLLDSRLEVDLVLLNLARDNEAVTDAQRAGLRAWARRMTR